MNKKNNILLGVILLLLGVYTIAMKFFDINYGSMPMLLAGAAFLLLYFTKEKLWALFIGFFIFLKGCSRHFSNISFVNNRLFWGLFFLLPGIFMVYKYRKTKQNKYLVPGSFSLWSGIFILSSFIECLDCISGGLLFICLGLTFLTSYLLSGARVGRGYIVTSIIMFLTGTFLMTGIRPASLIAGYGTYIGSVILIVISVTILIKAIKQKD